ncbi:MAG: heme o synthase [Chthoniobacterales bacterium]
MKAESLQQNQAESLLSDLSTLVKARLSFLVLITTLVGFLMGVQGPIDYLLLGGTLLGTALSACGAAALNQWWERELDAKMKRTSNRPLPTGRLHAQDALYLGIFLSVAGVVLLAVITNFLTSFLAALTVGSYLFVYTPLKRLTSLNTIVGAIPGAIPPVIGWTAAGNGLTLEAWLLFAILFLWQMPHFLAIAWMYRDDYAAAGFRMLTIGDDEGISTARQAVMYSLALLATSLLPGLIRVNSPVYFFGAFILGVAFSAFAVRFSLARNRGTARLLFFASILYLPLLLGLMVLTRIW